MSLAVDGRRGAETLTAFTAFTAFTFLTVAVTFLGVTGVDTLRAAVLRVRVLRGVATVMNEIRLYLLILHGHGLYYENRYTLKQYKKFRPPVVSWKTVPMSVVIRYNWMIWGENRVL